VGLFPLIGGDSRVASRVEAAVDVSHSEERLLAHGGQYPLRPVSIKLGGGSDCVGVVDWMVLSGLDAVLDGVNKIASAIRAAAMRLGVKLSKEDLAVAALPSDRHKMPSSSP